MRRRAILGDALHQAGRLQEALKCFRDAEIMMAKNQPQYPLLYLVWGFRYCDLLLAEVEKSGWRRYLLQHTNERADNALLPETIALCREVEVRGEKMLEWRAPSDSLLDIAVDYLTIARVGVYRAALLVREADCTEHIRAAYRNLETSVSNFHRSGIRQFIPAGLLSRSWLRVLEGDTDGSRSDLDEAWDIAERGPMRLHMADIHLYRARLFFREKHYPWKSPQDDLAAAEKLINDCDYHRRDQELADAKKAILGEV